MPTLKKKVHDALIARASAGTFLAAAYNASAGTLTEGSAVVPASLLANEIESAYSRLSRHGRKLRDDRTAWRWELRLRFHQEVITEPFEEDLLANPITVPRDLLDADSRQVIVSLLSARYEHPPQQGASNGTEVVFEVNAMVSPA